MAQLYFRYGAMNASKTMQLITVAHNYSEQGKKAIIFSPSIDTRSGIGQVKSRIGISKPAIPIDKNTDIIAGVKSVMPDCVLVDESQFLTKENVMSFVKVVDELNIPVICYGLLRDYQGKLFEGSKALIEWADKIEEIKTVCHFCNKKATHVLRVEDDKPVYEGEEILIGGNENYVSVCRKHWFKSEKI